MNIKRKDSGAHGWKSFFQFTGLFFSLSLVLLVIFLTANNLFVKRVTSSIINKVGNVLGPADTQVASINDLYRFGKGAISGVMQDYEPPLVKLTIKQNDLIKLADSIKNSERKWVKGKIDFIDYPGSNLDVKLRAKGDRELHHESIGDMSYRIKVKGDDRLFGLKKFSIQRPLLRGYTWELLFAEVLKNNGLLTLSSEPIRLMVNGDNRGVYVVEEVPTSRTVELQKRKNGPIYGLDEKTGTNIAAKLDVYDKKKWIAKPVYNASKESLEGQFYNAVNGVPFSSDLFDMDEWARYFALSDLFGTYHGTVPKSVKFYFNPVVGEFQPILFDAHKGAGQFNNFVILDFLLGLPGCEWICSYKDYYEAFIRNGDFLKHYIKYLKEFSSNEFILGVKRLYFDKFKKIDNLLYSKFSRNDRIFYEGFNLYLFKHELLDKRARLIKAKLDVFSSKAFIPSEVEVPSSQIESLMIPEIKVSDRVTVSRSNNINLSVSTIKFNKPTLWLLTGENKLNGVDGEPVEVIGPVMIVQLGGSLTADKLIVKDGVAFSVLNRNWSGSINIIKSNFNVEHLRIESPKSEDALNLVSSIFRIDEIEIQNSSSDGVDFDFSEGGIHSVKCHYIGNDCLDASESNVTIRDVDASFVKDKVVSAGENSIVNVENLRVKDSAIALVSKDGSILNNDSSEFDNVDLVLAVYNKKTEYKKPSISIRSIAVSPSLLGFKSVDGVLSIPDDRVEIQVHESKDILGRLYGKGFGVATKK